MINIDQIRAAHALAFWHANQGANQGAEGGDIVAGLPALIINNGLLATAAFCQAKGGGHLALFQNVLGHIAIASPAAIPGGNLNTPFNHLLTTLLNGTSLQLQQASSEALAYLGFLKRFAP